MRSERLQKIARFLCLAWIVPFVLGLVVYYGFTTNYTTGVFSEAGFEHRYENSVYRYRVLGRWIHQQTHRLIEDQDLLALAPRSLEVLDGEGSAEHYTAYFLSNTFFLCLTSSVLFLVLGRSALARSPGLADALLLLLCLLMAISQYVVVPYDMVSYFFLACAFYLIAGKPDLRGAAALGLVVALGTLSRETAALIPAFFLASHQRRLLSRPFRWNAYHSTLVFLLLCFAATYLAARLALGSGGTVFQSFRLWHNLGNPFSLAGLLFFAAILVVLLLDARARRECVVFLVACLPYLLFAVIVGQPWEIRLWVPVILSIAVLKTRV